MHFFKKFSIETYVLFLLPLAGIAFVAAVTPTASQPLVSLNTVLYFLLFGGYFLAIALFALSLYVCAKVLYFALSLAFRLGDRGTSLRELKDVAVGYVEFLLLIAVSTIFIEMVVNRLSRISPEVVQQTSEMLMRWDWLLFGAYPFLWLPAAVNAFPIIGAVLLKAYNLLALILPLALLLAFVVRKELGRRFLVFFFMAQFLSLPLWYVTPAISPHDLYIDRILDSNFDDGEGIRVALADYSPPPGLSAYLAEVRGIQQGSGNYLAVTAMPSLHAAWGAGVAYYGLRLWWPLGLAFSLWAGLEMIGAVYTAQHYAVDIIAGVLVAVLAIAIAERLFAFEKRYGPVRRIRFFDTLEADAVFLKEKFKALLRLKA